MKILETSCLQTACTTTQSGWRTCGTDFLPKYPKVSGPYAAWAAAELGYS